MGCVMERMQRTPRLENLEGMMTFAKVVETRSFSAAADMLNTSKSQVSKQISLLESALGVRLLQRTTRRMSLTEIGAAYYEHCVRIAHEIEAAAETVTQLQAEPRGVLRITSPVIFAALHLAPAMRTFLQRYEHVEIDLNASDRAVDIVEDGYDLAIRITDNPLPNMVARKIAPLRWATCAAPSYLERHGIPTIPQDLQSHQCLMYQGIPAARTDWRYLVGNKEWVLHPKGRCKVNSSEVLLQLAVDGMGVVLFPTYILGHYLQSGKLVEILHDSVANPNMSLYAIYPQNRYMQPKARAFIDHLLEHFGPVPPWEH
jgi:DNA-binding transcriptional LysR family regulator